MTGFVDLGNLVRREACKHLIIKIAKIVLDPMGESTKISYVCIPPPEYREGIRHCRSAIEEIPAGITYSTINSFPGYYKRNEEPNNETIVDKMRRARI